MFDYIDPAILPLGFFLLFCSIVGIIGNFLIVLCTVRTKRFRSPCHILIALTCLADILHLAGQFPFCVHLFGNLTSTQSLCYFIMLLPIVGLTITGPLILAMGIDRFIAIKFPIVYRYYLNNPGCYIFAQLIFPVTYCSTFIVYGQIKCGIPSSLNGPSFQMYTNTNAIILVFVFIVYLTVFIILKLNSASAKFRVVFRSIAVTVLFLLLGWSTAMLVNVVIYQLSLDPRLFHILQMYAGVTVNLAMASNFFVFYMINTEYREAFKSLLLCDNKINSIYQTDRNSSYLGALSAKRMSRENLKTTDTL